MKLTYASYEIDTRKTGKHTTSTLVVKLVQDRGVRKVDVSIDGVGIALVTSSDINNGDHHEAVDKIALEIYGTSPKGKIRPNCLLSDWSAISDALESIA